MDGYSFPVARGGNKDERSPAEKPYSAASYAAQYGVPMEDVQDFLATRGGITHGEVPHYIQKEHLSDPEFRQAALNLKTRPYGEDR